MKFDLDINIPEVKESFAPPDVRLSYKELNLLGLILASTINSHQTLKNADVYTATAVRSDLKPYYNKLAIKYSARLKYDHYSAFGEKGVGYAFKKIK